MAIAWLPPGYHLATTWLPLGYHLSTIWLPLGYHSADRRVLGADEELEDLSRADQVAYLQEWLDINGHTGRYEVDGDTLIWYRDISENPQEVGTVSRLGFEEKGAQLIIFFTLPNGDRYDWEWRRL